MKEQSLEQEIIHYETIKLGLERESIKAYYNGNKAAQRIIAKNYNILSEKLNELYKKFDKETA